MRFKTLTLIDIEQIKKNKRQVQLSYLGIVLVGYGCEHGFLVSIKEYQKLYYHPSVDIAIENEMSLNDFIKLVKKGLKDESILDNLFNQSAIKLTFMTRTIMVFVNFKYMPYLPIPHASPEIQAKLLNLNRNDLETINLDEIDFN